LNLEIFSQRDEGWCKRRESSLRAILWVRKRPGSVGRTNLRLREDEEYRRGKKEEGEI
jgi:hypothetical protein